MNAPPITSLDGFWLVGLLGLVSVSTCAASDGVGGVREANLRGEMVINTRDSAFISPSVRFVIHGWLWGAIGSTGMWKVKLALQQSMKLHSQLYVVGCVRGKL